VFAAVAAALHSRQCCTAFPPKTGKAFKDVPRESITICTKWGPMFDDKGGVSHTQTREYARKACEGALQRLNTSYIDLFTLRGPVQPGTDIAELMQELKV
jgi:aryl-alcohol dehydrogenase-like predicted oxidoreductase